MSMANRDKQQLPPTIEVERMSQGQRLEAIQAGIIEDWTTAPPQVRAFAEKASRRYLATFGND